jgi:hypothetical protein
LRIIPEYPLDRKLLESTSGGNIMERRKVFASPGIQKVDLLSVKTQDIKARFYVDATCMSGTFVSSSNQSVTMRGSFLSLCV